MTPRNRLFRTPTVFQTLLLVIALSLAIGSSIAQGAGDYPIVDTGQTISYDDSVEIPAPSQGGAFYGQDAQYDGNQPSFILSTDALTVYDSVTGLTWAASPDADGDGTLESPDDKLSWWDAMDFPDTLNAQSFGGYDDWRLPSIKELYSLIDFSGTDPSGYSGGTSGLVPFIDTDYFTFEYGNESVGERIIDSQYWSSTEYVGTTMNGDHTVFGVNFADGRIKGYGTSLFGNDKLSFAQCVRGNPDYGSNEFADNGDGTVTDTATDLMWMQGDSGTGMIWEDALAYAEELTCAGHDDWRLPNAKELQSILDYTRSPQTTGSPAIDPIFDCTTITDEGGGTNYPFYWTGTTHANWTESPGAMGVYVCFGEALGWMEMPFPPGTYQLMDVHGAGAQRSDPKTGDPDDWPHGNGPQGDVVRIYNYVRCVRDADDTAIDDGETDFGASLRFHPNPFSDRTELTLAMPAGVAQVTCRICSPGGRLVRTLTGDSAGGSEIRFLWDGASDDGAEVAAGVYFATLDAGVESAWTRVIVLK